ncbi:hypothetical protein FSARC_512 [Fusarium sarcochroum]|uniref:Uncharacterized protein n=1 Tax=Fusarium sarcochroum TaxID=1208366 RepID=A0A8H4XG74_9HYPO|nr:hypothetical protein FSARC_512 [Fusarium sarcochroum]
MDFFSRLPDLARTEIIIHVESEASIMKLIRASPTMLCHYTIYRQSIMRGILVNILAVDTTGSILQDAMAIMHLPPLNTTPPFPSIRNVIQQRIEQSFPNSLSQLDRATILNLYRLFSRIISFIEDYLSKSLDPFPPRAYMALPELAPDNTGIRFKGRIVDVKPVFMSFLTPSEKSRFLRAFLKHELLCKAYDTRFWETDDAGSDGEMGRLVEQLHFYLSQEDIRAIYCAYEYYKSLCGAIAAHYHDAWLPERPVRPLFGPSSGVHVPTNLELRYPDSLYFDSFRYLEDIDLRFRRLAVAIPSFGVDFLTSMFISMARSRDHGQSVWNLIYTLGIDLVWLGSTSWRFNLHVIPRSQYALSRFRSFVNSDSSILDWGVGQDGKRSHAVNTSFQDHLEKRGSWVEYLDGHRLHSVQVKVFRQRAWGMFDNDRLYPDIRFHLPSMSDLQYLSFRDWVENPFTQAEEARARRRSQKWHNYCSGQILVQPPQNTTGGPAEGQLLEDNYDYLPRFFRDTSTWKDAYVLAFSAF